MITRGSRIKDLLKNAIARDVVDRMELYGGVHAGIVKNPLVGQIRLSTLLSFARRKVGDADRIADAMIGLFNQEDGTKEPAPSNDAAWWKEADF